MTIPKDPAAYMSNAAKTAVDGAMADAKRQVQGGAAKPARTPAADPTGGGMAPAEPSPPRPDAS